MRRYRYVVLAFVMLLVCNGYLCCFFQRGGLCQLELERQIKATYYQTIGQEAVLTVWELMEDRVQPAVANRHLLWITVLHVPEKNEPIGRAPTPHELVSWMIEEIDPSDTEAIALLVEVFKPLCIMQDCLDETLERPNQLWWSEVVAIEHKFDDAQSKLRQAIKKVKYAINPRQYLNTLASLPTSRDFFFRRLPVSYSYADILGICGFVVCYPDVGFNILRYQRQC